MNSREEYALYIWGKHYPKPTEIKNRVISAAAGENHVVFVTSNHENYGFGSNKFGQLGLKENNFYSDPVAIFDKHRILNVYCGAEFTFFITEKYEVYSTGMNIKGQLGHSLFENCNTPKLVVNLIPFGTKNSKALQSGQKLTKPPIIEILESSHNYKLEFDLQVKIDDSNQSALLLNNDQFVQDISCGALFTIALTNKGRVFGCGFQGINTLSSHEQQLQKAKFKLIEFDSRISKIHSGLSGTAVLTQEGFVYVWGRFGKLNMNLPKKIIKSSNGLLKNEEDSYVEAKVGDQFVVLLNSKGEIYTFGENIENQLGCETHVLPFQQTPIKVQEAPFAQDIYVGRNSVFAVEAQTNELYAWGSNKHGQLFPVEHLKSCLKPSNSKFIIESEQKIIPSSYFTLFCSRRPTFDLTKHLQKQKKRDSQQVISMSEYKKLLNDYQIIKSMNIALLEKYQPSRKQSKEVQTTSKFQISGVTQFRKFNSNTEIAWKEIQLETQINQGGYGIIYRAKWREIQVVVKKFKIQNGDVSLRDFLSECHAMEAVRHPNIVMFLGAVTTNPHYSIVLEYCARGSLWSYLQNKDNTITWEDKRRFSIQIAQGVLYLHSCVPPILHRDLKSLNIFLDINLRIKIGDFGWTKTLEEYMTNKIGTYQWMAPQVIGNKPYTQKADIFSYSIILWQIASRQPPYRNITGAKVSEEVLNRQLRPTIPPKWPDSFVKLMKKCWQSDPSKRPSFKEIIRELQVMKL